jgi:hypothetical protein
MSRLRIEAAEAEVAVRLERAHAQLFGQGQGLLVVGCCQRVLRRRAPYCDLAQEVHGIRLVAALLVCTGMR